ncbi:hypothetical protein MKW94_008139, partial [Papaver nudicaule]|nr:hypothetical protein [Papaver nudicaule]
QRLDNGIDAEAKRQLTDDTVNSEAKLHALYLKWLAINEDYHFDVEDEKAYKERFGKFMDNARYINMRNKSASSTVCGLNPYSDLSATEFGSSRYKSYPKKANQVIAGIAEYMDNKAN